MLISLNIEMDFFKIAYDISVKLERETDIKNIMLASIHEAEKTMKRAIDEIDNPALSGVTCSPDYFCSLTEPALKALNHISMCSQDDPSALSVASIKLAHILSMYIIHGCATSNTSPDIIFGERESQT